MELILSAIANASSLVSLLHKCGGQKSHSSDHPRTNLPMWGLEALMMMGLPIDNLCFNSLSNRETRLPNIIEDSSLSPHFVNHVSDLRICMAWLETACKWEPWWWPSPLSWKRFTPFVFVTISNNSIAGTAPKNFGACSWTLQHRILNVDGINELPYQNLTNWCHFFGWEHQAQKWKRMAIQCFLGHP